MIARELESADSWVSELQTNAYGVKMLTLSKALELAGDGFYSGWYIAPFAVKWTVGRMSRDGRRYHVVSNGEPIRFDNMAEAFHFLGGILRVPAAPQLALAPLATNRKGEGASCTG